MTKTRTHETPNAVMTTLASPSLDRSSLAVWRVDMAPGASGPEHAVDQEQVLAVLAGELSVTLDGTHHLLVPGDALTLPAAVTRQVLNAGAAPASAMMSSFPGAMATVAGRDPVPIPWGA